jgi:isoquinoline 1-oxidoreductase subunit beta
MNKYFKPDSLPVSRRGFVAGGAGLTFAFTFSGLLSGRPEAFASASGAADKTIGGWVTITPDDKVIIAAPIAEMGQGVMTAIPMIVAEELDADWAKVEPIVPPQVPKLYGNPQLGGTVYVVASRTSTASGTRRAFTAHRRAAC